MDKQVQIREIRKRLHDNQAQGREDTEPCSRLLRDIEWLLEEVERLQADNSRLRRNAGKAAGQSGLSSKLKDALWE